MDMLFKLWICYSNYGNDNNLGIKKNHTIYANQSLLSMMLGDLLGFS